MGIQSLSYGDGVRIAILDSGIPPLAMGKDPKDEYAKLLDEFGHATAISSILFGGGPIKGICEESKPVFIKVLDSKGNGSVKSVVKGLYEALESDVDLINLSLGFVRTEKCPEELKKACSDVYNAQKTIICAAGNDGGPVNWPAALKTTICVGCSDKNGQKTAFSSSGEVDFVAPGVNLPVLSLDGTVQQVSGTSFATALVTGIAALLISSMRNHESAPKMPKIGFEKVKNALLKLTIDVDAPGWDENTGFGLISGSKMNTVDLKTRSSIFGTIIERIKKFFISR